LDLNAREDEEFKLLLRISKIQSDGCFFNKFSLCRKLFGSKNKTKLIDCYVSGLRLTLRGFVNGNMTSINIKNINQSPIDITKNIQKHARNMYCEANQGYNKVELAINWSNWTEKKFVMSCIIVRSKRRPRPDVSYAAENPPCYNTELPSYNQVVRRTSRPYRFESQELFDSRTRTNVEFTNSVPIQRDILTSQRNEPNSVPIQSQRNISLQHKGRKVSFECLQFNAVIDAIKKDMTKTSSKVSVRRLQLSLYCPITTRLMKYPARSRRCQHFECFDLESFLQMNQNVSTWYCPYCNRIIVLSDLIVDGFLLHHCNQNAGNMVEFTRGGQWKVIDEINENRP